MRKTERSDSLTVPEKVLLGAVLFVLWAAIVGLLSRGLQLLWNWLAVRLFKAPDIGYWESFGLLMTINIIIKLIRRSRAPDPA